MWNFLEFCNFSLFFSRRGTRSIVSSSSSSSRGYGGSLACNTTMAIYKTPKSKLKPRFPIIILLISVAVISFLYYLCSLISTNVFSIASRNAKANVVVNPNTHPRSYSGSEKFLYWGDRIDCPGKHCDSCAGLGHQESSLRCALEEAMFLQRILVMPSRMCINPIHNNKGILHQSDNDSATLGERWAASSCSMDSLYDLDLISATVPVILDNSETWHQALSTSMKLESRGVSHVQGISRAQLKEKSEYSDKLVINRTASPLAWFVECKDRKNRTALMLPYSFLPSMAAKKLRDAAEQVLQLPIINYKLLNINLRSSKIRVLLGDYDAVHVRRGDILKTRKDRFGVERSLHPHLDRDTRSEFILCRISKWVPPGRTLFIASNERTPGFFSPLGVRYKLAYSSNFSSILDRVIENNYQLFMIERLILMGAKTYIKTYKEVDTDLSLTDDLKKNTKIWQIPVYTYMDGEGC